METKLRKVIKDFMNCNKSNQNENIFRNDLAAQEFSKKVQSGNPKAQFERNGVVPTEFINYLQCAKIVQVDINWPKGSIKLKQLADLLEGCYKSVMIKRYPMLRRSFT